MDKLKTVEDMLKKLETQLNDLPGYDAESEHGQADELILQFFRDIGHPEVANAFNEASNRNRGFWYS